VRSISSRMRRGGSAQNQACGCVALWLPIAVAAARDLVHEFRMRAGAFADEEERGLRVVRIEQVEHRQRVADGPSSMVSQTTCASVGSRRSTGLNSAESGTSVPHQNGRCDSDHRRQADLPAEAPPQRDHERLRGEQAPARRAGWRGTVEVGEGTWADDAGSCRGGW
jgi:hypothetical protein